MMLRILADENIPRQVIEALEAQGYDVCWVRTAIPGSPDTAVLLKGRTEHRLLITFDKDFGELAFRHREISPAGIVLFRLPPGSPEEMAHVVVQVLKSRQDWPGHFSVIEPQRIRMIPWSTSLLE